MERGNITDYFREYEAFSPTILKRDLKVPLDSDSIITIMGPRRAGKTYYMFQLMRTLKDAVYLSFEDFRLSSVKYTELGDVIKLYTEIYGVTPKVLFLDEIQEMDNWELAVRTFHNLKSYRIFITGSSSKMLSKEIATQLRGRTLSYLLLSFSFSEYLRALNVELKSNPGKAKTTEIMHNLRQYLEFGGFPKVVYEQDKIGILREYSDLILLKDFIERHSIRNTSLARYLHETILQNFSREISINSLYENAVGSGLKVTKRTVYDYIDGLNDTVFFFFVERYSKKAHLRASWPKKVYLADTGLTKVTKFSEDWGRLMENAVFLQLMRRRNTNKLMDVYYWRDQKGEVDFLVREADRVTELVQVAYELNNTNIERETGAIMRASDALKCNSMKIITWDREETIKAGGKSISLVPLWKWLAQI
jgi:predicted AAA+ superfamily ATPase